ncbi:para-nitrobenzyl esterase-like [Diabrotica undecimpunctata]|uniref:para-nitrobenzyl esterase-like n=1 Tax=Diabrotica undecimpunctata TaxID=50387 RepID=UPI003B6406AF
MHLRVIVFCSLLYFSNKGVISSPITGSQFEEDDLIVELDNLGKIRGHILKSTEGKDFYAFQDVPYGESTEGNNRFRPPKPRTPWEGILNATENKVVCPQSFNPNSVEDCLVLNVYTPAKPSSGASLPVFFFIPGGAFVGGGGQISSFNPKSLVDFDIIIVTINYRLGSFGFLTTLDENIPGNLGLKDQLLALKWTHDHIHQFGGDPDKITLGGQSAGSMSAGFHLLSRAAKGLFRGIIQQSGSSLSTVFYPSNDRELAFEFGKALNSSFTSTDSGDLLELLQQASYSDLVALNSKFTSGATAGFMNALTFKPVIEDDNDDAFVTESMHAALLDGHFNLVPVLIGFNSEESLAFLGQIGEQNIEERAISLDENSANVVSRSLNVPEEDRENVGKELKAFYTSSFTDDRNALVTFTSDEVFARSTIRQAESASQYVPVYLYELTWLPENSTEQGVPHGAEMPYLWDRVPRGEINENLRKPYLKWWTNFIKYQNPTPDVDEDLQNVIWSEVKPDSVKYLEIDSQFTVKENPKNYYSIKNLLDLYIRPPYITY